MLEHDQVTLDSTFYEFHLKMGSCEEVIARGAPERQTPDLYRMSYPRDADGFRAHMRYYNRDNTGVRCNSRRQRFGMSQSGLLGC